MITKSKDKLLDEVIHLAVTISPKPNLKVYLNPVQQYLKYDYALTTMLSAYSQYYMRPELTLQGNIHYHLHLQLCTLKEEYKWLKSTIKALKQMGNTKIKLSKTPKGWINYIDKQKVLYDEIFNSPAQIGKYIEYTPSSVKYKLKRPTPALDISDNLDHGITPLVSKYTLKLNQNK